MEQTRDYRKLGLAIVISLFVHLVVGFSLAAFGSAFTPTLPALEEKPVELTIVDLCRPRRLCRKNPPYMETAPSKATVEKPKEQTFESNANSIAASKLPATGDLPLPIAGGQRATRRESGDARLFAPDRRIKAAARSTVNGRAGIETVEATQQPKAKALRSTPVSTPPAPVTTPEPEQFAMLKTTPPPPIKAPDETDAFSATGGRRTQCRHCTETKTRSGRFELSGAKRGNSHYRPADNIAVLLR